MANNKVTDTGYPRIRFPAAGWEYNTYADFKAAMREQAENQTQVNALRNQIPSNLFSGSLTKYNLETQVNEAIKNLKGGDLEVSARRMVSNHADVVTSELNGLIKSAKGAGYLDMITIKKIQTLLTQLGPSGHRSRSAYLPYENLEKLLDMLQKRVASSVLEDNDNLVSLMESAIQKNLPDGVRLKPQMAQRKAKEASSQLIGMTMTPRTASLYQTKVVVDDREPKVGTKYSRLPVKLGQLTQGLSQQNFFGTLRYFFYSSQATQEIKGYLAARYLRLFATQSQQAPVALIDVNGTIKSISGTNMLNKLELSAQGNRGAHYNTIKKAQREGLSPSDIAIRTWIESKNIKPAQEIAGYIRFNPGNLF